MIIEWRKKCCENKIKNDVLNRRSEHGGDAGLRHHNDGAGC